MEAASFRVARQRRPERYSIIEGKAPLSPKIPREAMPDGSSPESQTSPNFYQLPETWCNGCRRAQKIIQIQSFTAKKATFGVTNISQYIQTRNY